MSDWKFETDEVGEDAVDEPEPLEPGSPTIENALFVVLGVATMLFLFVRVLLVGG